LPLESKKPWRRHWKSRFGADEIRIASHCTTTLESASKSAPPMQKTRALGADFGHSKTRV
jgi:hypothetical protein